MNNLAEKIKYLWRRQNRDILYVFFMILIFGLIAGLFIWSMSIIIRAVDAAFVVSQQESFEVLSFDFGEFAKVALRLGIVFPSAEVPSETSPIEKVDQVCAQVLTPAVSPDGQCREFPTPCDAPLDWQKVDKCSANITDVSQINLEILNGTIIKGLAAQWAKSFEEVGFKAENIKTGNADKKDYVGIVVYYNVDDGVLAKINSVLSQSNLPIRSEKDEKLDNLYFRIIIGK